MKYTNNIHLRFQKQLYKAAVMIAALTLQFSTFDSCAQWIQKGVDIDGTIEGDQSGHFISLSADGNTVAIGAAENDHARGLVQIHRWLGTSWLPVGANIVGEAIEDEFGFSLSLSSSGNTVAIGAPKNDENGIDAGHAKIYQWDGSDWLQKGNNLKGDSIEDHFGWAVSLSGDGNILAIGSENNNGNGTQSGHVKIYGWDGISWQQMGGNISGDTIGDHLGWAISLSDNGHTIAIGAPFSSESDTEAGQVKIYNWDGASWLQKGANILGDTLGDHLGWSVSLSEDGNTVAIGAPYGGDEHHIGYAKIFQWIGNTWQQKGADIIGESAEDESGFSVSLSGDGNTIAIGAPGNDENGSYSGHVRVYNWNGSNWVWDGFEINGEHTDDESGFSVSLSSKGNTIAIGAPGNADNGFQAGHVRLYDFISCGNSNNLTINQNLNVLTVDKVSSFYQWIDCSTMQPISGENGQSLTVTQNGSYAVILMDADVGCPDTSSCFTVSSIGPLTATENLQNTLKVFPNPVSEWVNIEFGKPYKHTTIRIKNILGQTLTSHFFELTDRLSIPINGDPGTYFLEILTNDGKSVKIKLIKN